MAIKRCDNLVESLREVNIQHAPHTQRGRHISPMEPIAGFGIEGWKAPPTTPSAEDVAAVGRIRADLQTYLDDFNRRCPFCWRFKIGKSNFRRCY
jgi:hypothetical protein